VLLALLTDISAACGPEVIYRGARVQGHHRAGQGVCACPVDPTWHQRAKSTRLPHARPHPWQAGSNSPIESRRS
jgi:hypothetical protein